MGHVTESYVDDRDARHINSADCQRHVRLPNRLTAIEYSCRLVNFHSLNQFNTILSVYAEDRGSVTLANADNGLVNVLI